MKVAIIGGGASGMMSAHLLNSQHDVTVFEKEPILGGNIRTLNKNVKGTSLDKNIVMDNGVIEFAVNRFPIFVQMMENLKVKLSPFPGNGAIYFKNGKYFLGRNIIQTELKGFLHKTKEKLKLFSLLPDFFLLNLILKFKEKNLQNYTTGELLSKCKLHSWLRTFAMYAHSVPYPKIDSEYPAELCLMIFRAFAFGTKWSTIQTGIYTYIEKILESFHGRIFLNSKIKGVFRKKKGVEIQMESGEIHSFDRVVFSTPPEQVLKLLKDANEVEKKRFGGWKSNQITTIIHTDDSIYKPYPISYYSEFDIFECSNEDFGYNAYMNRIANLNSESPFFMGYNLEKLISSEKIIQRQSHTTPFYTIEGMKYRQEIKDTNGQNNTLFAGAYLYDGLHEGAATSATEVARILSPLDNLNV